MTPSAGAARKLVVERASGSRIEAPVTEANLCRVIRDLAPLVPHDAVWYTSPITPRR